MSKKFNSFKELREHFPDIPNDTHATVNHSGNYSKNVSVETIVNNSLFLFEFEESHVHNFLKVYNYYLKNNVRQRYNTLQNDLRAIGFDLIDNFSINPIECMLYASKIIDSYLSDVKLSRTIAKVIKMFYERLGHDIYTETLFHVVQYWGKWESQIKICIMASSKSMEYDLAEYIFDNFFDNLFYKVEVFSSMMDSKLELFIPTILEIINELNPSEETDRIIGNLFEKRFPLNFSQHNIDKYIGMVPISKSPYVLRKLEPYLGASTQSSLVRRMKIAKGDHEKKIIIDEAITSLKNRSGNNKELINIFTMSKLDYAGNRLLGILSKEEFKSNKWETAILTDCILCFVYLKHTSAIDMIKELSTRKKLKGIGRIALCVLGEIDEEILIRNYIQETDKEVLSSYRKGFSRVRSDSHFTSEVRKKILEAFHQVLSTKNEMFISTSIRNILALIKIHTTYYPFSLFGIIQELFGFIDQSQIKIKLQEQIYLLEIIELVIKDNNRHKYYDFLYYVEKENPNIKETVKQKANIILNNKYPKEYMGTS